MKNQLTLLHFENPEDLLLSIDMLQQHNIIIREIYSAEPVTGIETRLKVRQLRLGETIFRFGCLGGMGLTSLGYYLLQPHADWKIVLFNTIILLITLFILGYLLSTNVPRLITLKPGDGCYMILVDTEGIPVSESIAHLFQYTGAVELSPAIKNLLIS